MARHDKPLPPKEPQPIVKILVVAFDDEKIVVRVDRETEPVVVHGILKIALENMQSEALLAMSKAAEQKIVPATSLPPVQKAENFPPLKILRK